MRHCIVTGMVLLFLLMHAFTQEPPNISWKKISTPRFNLVFPEGTDSSALKITRYMEESITRSIYPVNEIPGKIDFYLSNHTATGNGYVTLAPRHMKWYTTPLMDLNRMSNTHWFHLLALHEYRHVLQYAALNRNFTRVMGYIFGQYGIGVMTGLSTPLWFMEGDAVVCETVHSRYGRGRLPSFNMDSRAFYDSHPRVKYDKACLSSYKHYVPDHYKFGYLLSTHIYRYFGYESSTWLMDNISRHSYNPRIFSKSLKQLTRYNLDGVFTNFLKESNDYWKKSIPPVIPEFEYHTPAFPLRHYTDILSFDSNEHGETYVLYNGLSDGYTLGILEKEKQIRPLTRTGYTANITAHGTKIAWAMTFEDIRYSQRQYSDIIFYQTATNTKQRFTRKQKYFYPEFSHDGKYLAVTEYTSSLESNLVILDAASGEVVHSRSLNNYEYMGKPFWDKKDERLVYIVTGPDSVWLEVCHWKKGTVQRIAYQGTHISSPAFYHDFVLFNAALGERSQIHALNPESGIIYKVLEGKYGVFDAKAQDIGQGIAFRDYSPSGHRLAAAETHSGEWEEVRQDSHEKFYFTPIRNQMDSLSYFPAYHEADYPIVDYVSFKHLIQFHSWTPRLTNYSLGLQLFSHNDLNTFTFIPKLEYYPDFGQLGFGLEMSYHKYFPVITSSSGILYRHQYNYLNGELDMNDTYMNIGVLLPLNFSNALYSKKAGLEFETSYRHFKGSYVSGQAEENRAVNGIEYPFLTKLFYAWSKSPAKRDIYAPLFFKAGLRYKTGFKEVSTRDYFSGNVDIGLEGLFDHHHLILRMGFLQPEALKAGQLPLDSLIRPLRGYDLLWPGEMVNFSINYTFPVFYPDIRLGGLFYFKRIRANLFYDKAYLNDLNLIGYEARKNDQSLELASTGIELETDFHLFRLPPEMSAGIQITYPLDYFEKPVIKGLFLGVEF